MQKLVSDLQKLPRLVEKTITACSISTTATTVSTALATVAEESKRLADRIRKDTPREHLEVRRQLTVLANTFAGLSDGVSTRELSRKQLKASFANVTNIVVPAYQEAWSVSIEKLEAFVSRSQLESDDEEPAEDDEDAEDELEARRRRARIAKLESKEEQAIAEIHQLQGKLKKLPRHISEPFAIVRNPVVPIFNRFIPGRPQNFERRGIRAISIDGENTVLDDQVLLCIDTKFVAGHGLKLLKYAELVVENINRQGSVKYGLMSDMHQANPNNPALAMFWLLALNKKFGGFQPGECDKWSLLTLQDKDVHQFEVNRLADQAEKSKQVDKNRVDRAAAQRKADKEAHEAALQKKREAQQARQVNTKPVRNRIQVLRRG